MVTDNLTRWTLATILALQTSILLFQSYSSTPFNQNVGKAVIKDILLKIQRNRKAEHKSKLTYLETIFPFPLS